MSHRCAHIGILCSAQRLFAAVVSSWFSLNFPKMQVLNLWGSGNKGSRMEGSCRVLSQSAYLSFQIDYTGGSVSLYGNAQLDTCPSDCEIDEIFSKIQLDTKHIGKGCDRDTYSVRSQRKLCNANTSGEYPSFIKVSRSKRDHQTTSNCVREFPQTF